MNNLSRHFTLLVSILWIIGFSFSLPIVRPYEIARLVSIAGLFSATALVLGLRLAGTERGFDWPCSKVLAAAALFWLSVCASVLWSKIPFNAFIGACSFTVLPLGTLLFLLAPDPGLMMRICAWGAGIVLGAMGLWAVTEYLVFPDLLTRGQVRWPFANPAGYAAFLTLAFFPALGQALCAPVRLHALLGRALASITMCAIIIIGSRGVILVTAGVLALFFLIIRGYPYNRGFRLWLMVAALGAFLIPLGITHSHQMQPLDRMLTLSDRPHSVDVRMAIWRSTAAMIAQHPFLGTGIGTFSLYYPQYRLPEDTNSSGLMAHNDPLQFWAEAGILAPLFFYAFAGMAASRMMAAMRAAAPGSRDGVIVLSIFCALAAIILHAHVDFDFYQLPILCLYGPLLAYWHRATGKILDERTVKVAMPSSWPPAAGWALSLLPAIGILFVLQGFLLSEFQVNTIGKIIRQSDYRTLADVLNRADRMAFGANPRVYVLAASIPVDILASPSESIADSEKKSLQLQAGELLDKAQARNPRLVMIPAYRASLAEDRHDPAAEEDFLLRALTLEPANALPRILLVELYRRQGRTTEASRILHEGLLLPCISTAAACRKFRDIAAASASGETPSTATGGESR